MESKCQLSFVAYAAIKLGYCPTFLGILCRLYVQFTRLPHGDYGLPWVFFPNLSPLRFDFAPISRVCFQIGDLPLSRKCDWIPK